MLCRNKETTKNGKIKEPIFKKWRSRFSAGGSNKTTACDIIQKFSGKKSSKYTKYKSNKEESNNGRQQVGKKENRRESVGLFCNAKHSDYVNIDEDVLKNAHVTIQRIIRPERQISDSQRYINKTFIDKKISEYNRKQVEDYTNENCSQELSEYSTRHLIPNSTYNYKNKMVDRNDHQSKRRMEKIRLESQSRGTRRRYSTNEASFIDNVSCDSDRISNHFRTCAKKGSSTKRAYRSTENVNKWENALAFMNDRQGIGKKITERMGNSIPSLMLQDNSEKSYNTVALTLIGERIKNSKRPNNSGDTNLVLNRLFDMSGYWDSLNNQETILAGGGYMPRKAQCRNVTFNDEISRIQHPQRFMENNKEKNSTERLNSSPLLTGLDNSFERIQEKGEDDDEENLEKTAEIFDDYNIIKGFSQFSYVQTPAYNSSINNITSDMMKEIEDETFMCEDHHFKKFSANPLIENSPHIERLF